MKEVLIKQYDILISAPADVFDYVETVKKAINDYNNGQGLIDNIRFTQKNWKEHALPSYGKSAQTIINEQITNQAEIVIALFGAKFGEPTEKYSSGTLEEIETVHKNGGLVWTFFGKGKIVDVSRIDPEQLKKVQEYKANYNGLYKEFSSKKNLLQQLVVILSMTAQKLKNVSGNDLKIYAVEDDELKDTLSFTQYDFFNSPVMDERKKEIINLITQINDVVLERPKPVVKQNNEYANLIPEDMLQTAKKYSAIASLANVFPTKQVFFESDFLDLIKMFAEDNDLSIQEDFLYMRNGGYTDRGIMGRSICGDEKEKKKISLLLDLENLIYKYFHTKDFLKQYQDGYYLKLAIKNESNIFADDITIKLYLDKSAFVNPSTLTLNEQDIGDIVKDFPRAFEKKDSVDIENMCYGDADYPHFIPYHNPITYKSSVPDLDYYKKYFEATNQELYPFVVNDKGSKSVIKIDLAHGLKQFSAQFLCASILLRQPVECIDYIITSKSFGHEIKGRIVKE